MKKLSIIFLIFYSLSLVSCDKLIEIDAPKTQIEKSEVFKDDATALAAASGVYFSLSSSNSLLFNGLVTLYTGLSSDEIINTSTNSNYDSFVLNALDPTNHIVSGDFWLVPYEKTYYTNSVISGLENATSLSEELKNQLLGEMLFIRALHYFYMVNVFGDVPLVTSPDFEENELMPRTPQSQVWEQIIANLEKAKTLLSEDYPNANKLRVNKYAAIALLARAHLFQSNYEKVIEEATQVITSGKYTLTGLENVFLPESEEAILQLTMPLTSTLVTSEATLFVPTSATRIPTFQLTEELKNAFEDGDARNSAWTNQNIVGGNTYTYPYKYKIRTTTAGSAKPERITVLRFAELFLLRAEAYAKSGNQTAAIADLNKIRERAQLPIIPVANPTLSEEDLQEAIQQENRIEFFAEWGHRWLDLKRTGTIDEVLSVNKSSWKPYAKYFPIPFSEIRKNPYLTQNEGYN